MKARGEKELNKYIDGKKLTLRQMILAKCFECMGNYDDGKVDCELSDCPLYPMMPYGKVWQGRQKGIIPPGFAKHRLQKIKGIKKHIPIEAERLVSLGTRKDDSKRINAVNPSS
jgi:hypothetical protein